MPPRPLRLRNHDLDLFSGVPGLLGVRGAIEVGLEGPPHMLGDLRIDGDLASGDHPVDDIPLVRGVRVVRVVELFPVLSTSIGSPESPVFGVLFDWCPLLERNDFDLDILDDLGVWVGTGIRVTSAPRSNGASGGGRRAFGAITSRLLGATGGIANVGFTSALGP
mmetsp:Transcript_34927/g.81564  ORF Transcript_34927/g.81564 Transcript_34927/m.81564 type:complete len:165 (-) Transcript_34927:7-501(-)